MSSEGCLPAELAVAPTSRRLFADLHARANAELLSSLPSGEPSRWLYDLLPVYPRRAGKGLRPVLCLASCAAFGGAGDALPFAVALELMHNAFLVHDDIQDGSQHRRGRPTLHVEHGVPLALNVGDALAALANSVVARGARALRPALMEAVLDGWEQMTRETIEGQALDLGWQRDHDVEVSIVDYLEMAAKKTAWYTGVLPLSIGALVGSGDAARHLDVFGFGWYLGLLFQIVNDLDGVCAAPGQGDIEEGKRTLPIVVLQSRLQGADRDELVRILALDRCRRSPHHVEWVRDRMLATGAVDAVRSCAFAMAAAAAQEADSTFGELPPSDPQDLLRSLPALVLEQGGLVRL